MAKKWWFLAKKGDFLAKCGYFWSKMGNSGQNVVISGPKWEILAKSSGFWWISGQKQWFLVDFWPKCGLFLAQSGLFLAQIGKTRESTVVVH